MADKSTFHDYKKEVLTGNPQEAELMKDEEKVNKCGGINIYIDLKEINFKQVIDTLFEEMNNINKLDDPKDLPNL